MLSWCHEPSHGALLDHRTTENPMHFYPSILFPTPFPKNEPGKDNRE